MRELKNGARKYGTCNFVPQIAHLSSTARFESKSSVNGAVMIRAQFTELFKVQQEQLTAKVQLYKRKQKHKRRRYSSKVDTLLDGAANFESKSTTKDVRKE